MPIDPSISTRIAVPKAPNSLMADPLGTMSTFADIQNKRNQNRLFQQNWLAGQKFGQIVATSGTLADALDKAAKDPDAAWMAPYIASAREAMSAQATFQSTLQGMQAHAYDAVKNILIPSFLANPTQDAWDNGKKAVMSVTPDLVKPSIGGPDGLLDTLYKSLFNGMHPNPNADPDILAANKENAKKNMIGLGATADPTGILLGTTTGTTSVQVLGGGYEQRVFNPPPLLQKPPVGIGPVVGGGTAPATTTIGDIPVTVGVKPSGYPVAATPADALMPTPVAPGTNPIMPVPKVNQAPAGAPSGQPAAGGPVVTPLVGAGTQSEVQNRPAGTGVPLFDQEDLAWKGPSVAATGPNGVPVLTPGQKAQQEAAIKDFSDLSQTYRMANQTLGSIAIMDADAARLAQSGSFLNQGTAQQARAAFAKGINTIAGLVGAAPPFDPTKVAASEELAKEWQRMGMGLVTQFFGGDHAAVDTIKGALSAVPGGENSHLGYIVISGAIKAATQRMADEYDYINGMQSKFSGNPTGAAARFNNKFPATNYLNPILAEVGIGPDASPKAVQDAALSGKITFQEAGEIMAFRWPDQYTFDPKKK